MPKRRPRVSIIVVTVNTPAMTRACLASVIRHTASPYELIVVNNARPQTICRIVNVAPQARVIQNAENLGYATAANQGARAARGDYLCFLNSDTLVPSGWTERLVAVARRPGVGAVGPVTVRWGYPYPWPPRELPLNDATTGLVDRWIARQHRARLEHVPWLPGFCLMIPRAVLRRVGVFDERFFFGSDDVDYSLRLRLAGYRLLRLSSLFVYHQWGGSVPAGHRQRLFRQANRQLIAKWGFPADISVDGAPPILEAFERWRVTAAGRAAVSVARSPAARPRYRAGRCASI